MDFYNCNILMFVLQFKVKWKDIHISFALVPEQKEYKKPKNVLNVKILNVLTHKDELN